LHRIIHGFTPRLSRKALTLLTAKAFTSTAGIQVKNSLVSLENINIPLRASRPNLAPHDGQRGKSRLFLQDFDNFSLGHVFSPYSLREITDTRLYTATAFRARRSKPYNKTLAFPSIIYQIPPCIYYAIFSIAKCGYREGKKTRNRYDSSARRGFAIFQNGLVSPRQGRFLVSAATFTPEAM